MRKQEVKGKDRGRSRGNLQGNVTQRVMIGEKKELEHKYHQKMFESVHRIFRENKIGKYMTVTEQPKPQINNEIV
ncbi:hypothetical protein SLEP1_g35888 [Rubroshorea leprosula]|uniref:Uncharacterized protein n=1 Tax=Rubroshorea leprosula TaxID=152421 RepID=A0AAV5KQ10_9ROSI|nr:hypothetical protein SLEP1_g35888 [Rubroshorea leprosula]